MANGPIIDLVVEPRTGTYHDPNDQTTRRPRSDQRRSGDGLNNAVMWFQMKFIVGAAMLVTSFWLFHYLDVRWVNATAFLMLTIYIWVAGTSLKWLIAVFTFGALVRPGSETARLLAGTEAVKVWVTKWVMLVLHAVQLCALFFMVWPFEVNFGQFVMGTIALIFVGVSIVRFNITLGKWLENISFWGGTILFVAVLASTAFGFNPFATRDEIGNNLPSSNSNAGQQQAAVPHRSSPVVAATPATQHPGERRVYLPKCDNGWSEEIQTESGYDISPGYSLASLGIEYLSLDNGWVSTHPGSGNFVSIRFCASNERIAGRSMGVRFLPKT